MAVVLEAGARISERYSLVRLLGEGGMGSVWAATHVITRKPVALKFLKSDAMLTESHVRRFLREARAASAVRHPNVVQIHDILELEGGAPVMVMDLLRGESLGDRLVRVKVIPIAQLAPMLLPVASAVGTAHAVGVIHRDLKPDNIFLEVGHDGGVTPKVLDFGIAKVAMSDGLAPQSAQLTQTGAMLGTPYYMAPEQAFGEKNVDHRVDIWAFGVILYECLAGRRPVDGDNLGQLLKVLMTGGITPLASLAPKVPRDVTDLVGRMMSLKREERPEDMREVFAVLQRYTDARAESFSGARPVIVAHSDRPVAPSNVLEVNALAHTEEAGALASTRQPPTLQRPRKAYALGTGLVLACAAVALAFTIRARRTSGAVEPQLTDLRSPAADWGQDPGPAVSSVASALAPSPAASSASSAASSTPPPPRTTTGKTRAASSVRDENPPPPAGPTASAPPTPTRLPGGVVSGTPF